MDILELRVKKIKGKARMIKAKSWCNCVRLSFFSVQKKQCPHKNKEGAHLTHPCLLFRINLNGSRRSDYTRDSQGYRRTRVTGMSISLFALVHQVQAFFHPSKFPAKTLLFLPSRSVIFHLVITISLLFSLLLNFRRNFYQTAASSTPAITLAFPSPKGYDKKIFYFQ